MDRNTMSVACAATDRVVIGIRSEHLTNATPCAEWDVRALLNHLVGTLYLGTALLSDTMPSVAMVPGGVPDDDVVDGDPTKAYRLGTESLLAAATGDTFERVHVTPLGEMPGAALAGFTTLDILVHGWDLAKATNQDPVLPAAIAEEILGFAQQSITDDMRAPRIGPAIAAPASASATDRLVAFLGRQP
jgi:uncharacterized protein (TIGR03086 family)